MLNRIMSCILSMVITSPAFASWKADNGNGTYSNPLFYEEFSDPDIIRVGKDYYLTGTTNHCMPGLPVLHSSDLVNWKLLGYAFDPIDLSPEFRLEGDEIYGQGIWAPALRFKDGIFYIFSNINGYGTQLYRSDNPAGPWKHNWLKTTLYDLSVLFDDDGRIYAVHDYNEIKLTELNQELTDVIPGTTRVIIPRNSGMGEGLHFYKFNGTYYILTAIPGAHTPMRCARSKDINGPYEIITISEKESMGIGLSYRTIEKDGKLDIAPPDVNHQGGLTLHQGGIVDTPSGQWWGVSMMDHNGLGRTTCLSPITWQDDWPYFGLPNNLTRTPRVWIKPDTGHKQEPTSLFDRNDDFNGEKLATIWQWNHMPDDSKWSLQERPGYLRLHALPASELWWAKNTLTQRAAGPESIATVTLETAGLEKGDIAGLALFNRPYHWVGVSLKEGELFLSCYNQLTNKTINIPINAPKVWLRAHCNFDIDIARLSYSLDGIYFTELDEEIKLPFQMKTFQGVRYGLFCYNENGTNSGHADFDSFQLDEPRDRGLSRPIPYGKKIILTSSGSGLKLGMIADNAAGTLLGSPFTIIDMGQGRVALQNSAGKFLSVADIDNTTVTTTANNPGLNETFQWVDMQRNDLMLLSLTTNRFIQITDKPGVPANADIRTPRPDRQDGSVFNWIIIE